MPVWRCCRGWLFGLAMLAAATSASAQAVRSFHLPAGGLTSSLNALARQADIELLFVPSLTEGRPAPRLEGTLSVPEALARLLAGSGLAFRESADGTFVVTAGRAAAAAPAEPTAVPEILVIGRRTQDADIRRTEDDIQPYRVESAHDIETSRADTVDDLFRSRLSSNAEIASAMQDPSGQRASTRSEIDLHGLGASQTLVLVDGRRMPSLPTMGDNLLQPDLNGIPLSAIDRIETLTAAAGGIYGPGATGGVVNVILKRDYRGADLNVSFGESQRGDAARAQIDGRIGFTPDGGQTDVSLSFSRVVTGPLRAGDRDYEEQGLQLRSRNAPAAYAADNPLISGLFISSIDGPLELKPGYGGGGPLGSGFTFLPPGYGGVATDGGALLRANAGMLPSTLSPDGKGTPASLESNPSVTSILINVRRRFGDKVEAFLDVIDLRNVGHAQTSDSVFAGVSPDAPTSPFTQYANVILPLPGFGAAITSRTHMTRISGGLILTLPLGWRADVDYSRGIGSQDTELRGGAIGDDFYDAVYTGLAGAGGRPALNPFGDWTSFVAALQAYRLPTLESIPLTNRMGDASLRLAGPVAQLPAGPLTLSLLAEDRREEVAASNSSSMNLISDGLEVTQTPRLRQRVSSLYGELRAPLAGADSAFAPLRGLEAQLAVRYDRNTTILPANFDADAVNAAFVTARQGAVVYTAGLKIQPLRSLMLRSSVATGVLPPAIDQLGTNVDIFSGTGVGDPERGGRELGSELPVEVLSGGSASLKPERSRSLSVGAVFQPGRDGGLRISLDFTRLDKTREISYAHGYDFEYFLANAAAYPGRVVRAPLSAADAALGFTGGVVTRIDTTNLNIGATVAEMLDLGLDYSVLLPGAGRLRIRGAGTWEPLFKQRSSPDAPWVGLAGYYDGPLTWRGNATVEWSKDRLSVGANVQYYGRYQVATSAMTQYDLNNIAFQGSAWIPSQTYVDLFATYLVSLPTRPWLPRSVALRLGIEDVFDKSPPIVASFESYEGYSTYGDPRRRRFTFAVASRF